MTRKTSDFLSQKKQEAWFAMKATLLFTETASRETNSFRRIGFISGACPS